MGLRNLVRAAKEPEITLRLTNGLEDHKQPKPITIDKTWLSDQLKKDETYCPNFGQVVPFKEISLPSDPMLWPFIEISVTDLCRKDNFFNKLFKNGCEDSFTTLSLVDFQDDICSNF